MDDSIFQKAFSQGRKIPDWPRNNPELRCCFCGRELLVYYSESRLYAVTCDVCETVTLVKAGSPKEAAYKARAFKVVPADDAYDGCYAFFSHVPIDEPPVYIGSTEDEDFPDDANYAIDLPCPATDGGEYLNGKNDW